MSEPSQNSQNEEKQKKTEKAKQLEGTLRNKKVKVDDLVVFLLGAGEQLIGEADSEEPLFDEESDHVMVRNPKRIISIRQMDQQRGAMSVQYMLGDFDLVSEGLMTVKPIGWFHLSDLGPESYEAYLGLYMEFLERNAMNKAQAAGLHLPNRK